MREVIIAILTLIAICIFGRYYFEDKHIDLKCHNSFIFMDKTIGKILKIRDLV